jgi:hypothetical protein
MVDAPTLANVATTPTAAAPPAPSTSPAPALSDRAGQPAAAKPVPGSKEWAQMTPEARHAALRGPENPRARGHSPAVEQREAAAARAAGEPPAVPDDPQAPAHSTEKLKVGKYEVSEADLATMMDRQAQDDLRKATIPPSPDAYELKISPDAKLPGSVEFKFDGNDPRVDRRQKLGARPRARSIRLLGNAHTLRQPRRAAGIGDCRPIARGSRQGRCKRSAAG